MNRLTIFAAAIAASVTSIASAATLKVYHIGNSVTDTIRYTGLGQLATAGGDSYSYGRHMIPGAPLAWIYQHPNDGFREPSGYTTALPQAWTTVTLQPFDRQLGTPTDNVSTENDLPIIREYVKLLRQNAASASSKVYVYSRWPRRDEVGGVPQPINFQQKWNRTYTGGWDGTNESRDYFERVLLGTRQIMTNLGAANPVYMVPVGDVLNELDLRMEAGQIPGYTDVVQLYADGIHFNNVGAYVVGLTFYSTLYGDSPLGLPVTSEYSNVGYNGAAALPISPALAAALQDTVWDIVNGHAYSGVNVVPEPTAATLLLAAPLMLRRRRR